MILDLRSDTETTEEQFPAIIKTLNKKLPYQVKLDVRHQQQVEFEWFKYLENTFGEMVKWRYSGDDIILVKDGKWCLTWGGPLLNYRHVVYFKTATDAVEFKLIHG